MYYLLLILLPIFFIFIIKPKKTSYPKGQYVLKIIVNKRIKKDIKLVTKLLKQSIMNLMDFLQKNQQLYKLWRQNGEAKIVLCGTDEDFDKVKTNCRISCIKDEGFIQMLIVGPGEKKEIDSVTSHFVLY